MHLDKIEIQNFKSYKGTHIIGPFDRFSCIIGPNGSGKSNILDAISFVLNVPNNCLRVKNMKHLVEHNEKQASVKIFISNRIFERKLIKQEANMLNSDGSLLLDNNLNQDITNSTICKYYVDQIKVTQKAYNIELETLNILSKIKNFVIYQGDIIKSDVNLLNMIEIICGSASYIEEYEMLGNKISGMNKDLGLKYEKRKDILEMMKEMNDVKAKEKNFENFIIQKEEAQRQLYELEIKKKKEELSKARIAISKLGKIKEDQQYDDLLNSVNKLRSEAAKLQKDYFEKETELSFAKSRQVKKSDFDFEGKSKELENLNEKLIKINDDLSKLPEIFSFENKHGGNQLTKEMFESLLQQKEKEFLQKTANLEKELAEITLQNFDKINRRDQIQATIKQSNLKAQRIISRNREIEKENLLKQEKMSMISKEISRLNLQIEDKVQSYDRIVSDEEKLNKEFNGVMKEILLNKAKKNDLTRKSLVKGVVENLKTIFSGVSGRVIDLIQPTQKKYELAVGVLLSKYDQAVIVDNEKTAMDCLRYIKETRSCKLTFLPLSRMKSYHGDENLKENADNNRDLSVKFAENLAKNCISYDLAYEKVIYFIFRNSLILDSDLSAKNVIYSQKYPGSVCTLNGTLFTSSGLITGGKSILNKFEDNLIDSLLMKRKAILNDIKINKDRKEAFADVETIKLRIGELENKKSMIKLEKIEIEMLKDLNTINLEKELGQLESFLLEFERIQRGIKESKKLVEKSVYGELMSLIGMNSLSEFKERMKSDMKRQELLMKSESLKDKINIVNEELKTNVQGNSEIHIVNDITGMEVELNRVYVALEDVKERLKAQNQNLKIYSVKRDEINRSILNHQLHISKLEEDIKDLIKYAELEFNYKDNLGIENLNISDSNRSTISDQEISALKVKIEDLNRQINENVPTVSSSDSSIQAKYSKANREYEIAKEAIVTTKRRLSEVKKLRMESFSRCFELVSSEITEIYRQLTMDRGVEQDSESNAYLVYEGDPFINNLKYYLMPPSKRFIPFHELSGGERSIALLAFIFALSKFRKSPFYIFDEIDSALDKVNVERLGRYLSESTDQFLVVSLKPQFFSKSDSLFGVYKCPTTNTSRVLSLKIN